MDEKKKKCISCMKLGSEILTHKSRYYTLKKKYDELLIRYKEVIKDGINKECRR